VDEDYPKRIDACTSNRVTLQDFHKNTPMHQGAPRYDNTEHLEKIKENMFNEHVDEFAKSVDPALAEKFRSKDPNEVTKQCVYLM
jgi:hypothetical protein